ncbi:MAG: hypothetical protein PWQ82_1165 [Thermosediminibacterales bacterium]|nr:hypothetical protein [Thermosediminibacterales bacterium]
MINIEIVDECEAKMEIDEKFYITRNELDEFREKLVALIEEYRI